MAKDPAALLYIDKWIVATTEMQATARAYYMDLILHQFDKGDLPSSIEELATICRVRFSEFDSFKHVFEHVLKQKFELNETGRLENEFAREIIQKRKMFLDKRSRAGQMSYVIRYAIKTLQVNKEQIEYIKNNIDLDKLDIKNEHMLKQMLKQIVELYINVNEDENIDINKNKGIKKFVKPTLEEVVAYCHERKNNVDPERWLNYYTANGFKVGKNQMKDWRASVRTWEGNNRPPGNLSHLAQAAKIDSDY